MKQKGMKITITILILAVILLVIYILSGKNRNDKPNENEMIQTPKSEQTEKPDDEQEQQTQQPVNKDEESELITIGFAQVGHESAWRKAATDSAIETFSVNNGYKLIFVDCDNDSEYQKKSVMEFVEQRLDYIVIDPIVTNGWDEVLYAAKNANIPVFLIDRTIDCDESLYEAWFGSDFEAEGEAAGAWLEAYLENKGREIDEIKILTIAGTMGSAAQQGRTKGFDKYVAKHANWTKLDERDGGFTKEDGKKIMQEYIDEYGKVDVIVCQNDNESWGVMEALDEAGMSYGVDGDIIIISFDAVHEGLSYVLEGKINADFECNPLSAPYVEDAIRKLENGESIDKKTNYIDEDCFQAEDNVGVIEYAGKTANMITVTKEVLNSRAY